MTLRYDWKWSQGWTSRQLERQAASLRSQAADSRTRTSTTHSTVNMTCTTAEDSLETAKNVTNKTYKYCFDVRRKP